MKPLTAQAFSRLRGFGYFMASQGPAKNHWQEMKDLGAGLVRCWYSARLEKNKYIVDTFQRRNMFAACESAVAAGLIPVVCVGVSTKDMPFLPGRADAFMRLWRSLHRVHQKQPAVVFDLLNEPMPPEGFAHVTHHSPEQCERIGQLSRDLYLFIAGALSTENPQRLLVVELGLGADPIQFSRQKPLSLPNVVHSAHFYLPHSFTHHGVSEAVEGRDLPWPKAFDKESLSAMHAGFSALDTWSSQYGLPIFIGEFSAHNVLPDAAEYISRCVTHFNSRGWPWSYHDWRQWFGWHPTESTLRALNTGFLASS